MSMARSIAHMGMIAAALAPAMVAPAAARDDPTAADTSTSAKDGELIYSRDVRHSIGARHLPGQSHAAGTAPTRAIIGSVFNGLAPLTDSEAAGVAGEMQGALSSLAVANLSALLRDNPETRVGASLASPAATLSGTATIGSAMGVLGDALGALSAIGGARP